MTPLPRGPLAHVFVVQSNYSVPIPDPDQTQFRVDQVRFRSFRSSPRCSPSRRTPPYRRPSPARLESGKIRHCSWTLDSSTIVPEVLVPESLFVKVLYRGFGRFFVRALMLGRLSRVSPRPPTKPEPSTSFNAIDTIVAGPDERRRPLLGRRASTSLLPSTTFASLLLGMAARGGHRGSRHRVNRWPTDSHPPSDEGAPHRRELIEHDDGVSWDHVGILNGWH